MPRYQPVSLRTFLQPTRALLGTYTQPPGTVVPSNRVTNQSASMLPISVYPTGVGRPHQTQGCELTPQPQARMPGQTQREGAWLTLL